MAWTNLSYNAEWKKASCKSLYTACVVFIRLNSKQKTTWSAAQECVHCDKTGKHKEQKTRTLTGLEVEKGNEGHKVGAVMWGMVQFSRLSGDSCSFIIWTIECHVVFCMYQNIPTKTIHEV